MKSLKSILVGVLFYIAIASQAQIVVNVSIGEAPQWGPAGYTNVRYYYLPDIEVYYDIQSSMYIYIDNSVWIRRHYLPVRFKGYDLYGGYKVVMQNYYGNFPYRHFNEHKIKYAKGYRGKNQKNIGQKPAKSGINSKSNNSTKNKIYQTKGNKGTNGNMKQSQKGGGKKGKK